MSLINSSFSRLVPVLNQDQQDIESLGVRGITSPRQSKSRLLISIRKVEFVKPLL
jgi:hypothetical protein